MELRQIRSFIAVAHALSFSKAAHELHLSQPALSAQIQALESDLGVQLLIRNRRMVKLTRAGESFLQNAEALLQKIADARLQAQLIAQGNAGHLRVGFVASAALQLVPAIVLAFRKRYPKVSFDLKNIRTVDQVEALANNMLDAGFVRLPLTASNLIITPVHREPFVLAMSKNHPLARTKKFSLSDFAEEPFVAYGRRWAPEFYDTWVGICRRSGFSPNVVQETAEMDTTLALVAAGIGVAILPQELAQRHSRELKIRDLPNEKTLSQIGIAIPRTHDNPLIDNLVAIALETGKR